MLLFANAHRKRSAAALVLLGWLLVLFAGIAHACVPGQPSWPATAEHMAADIAPHGDCMNEGSDTDSTTCKMFCDAQASAVTKEKASDTPGLDQPACLSTASYFIAPRPDFAFQAAGARDGPPLFDPHISLRFTRLTL